MIPSSSRFIVSLLIVATTTLSLIATSANAVRFDVKNNCPFTVWAASFPVGGGQRLGVGQTWTLNVPLGTTGARIWARTGCTFDRSGGGRCQTGDCDGQLLCQTYGAPPATVAEFSLRLNYQNLDFFDISLADGFNVPMEFSPADSSGNCTRGPSCNADIIGQCPSQLRTRGGCNDPCTVFKTEEYCCARGRSCGPTDYSRFFKSRCPDAYSYRTDNQDTVYRCPGGGVNYRVVFCP